MAEPVTLTPAELRMITTLRNMPESPLRDRVNRLLEDLLAFARNPRCHELQADGVPCKIVLEMLDSMGKRLPRE